jgi:predicted HicB family RNase H-like nuclease
MPPRTPPLKGTPRGMRKLVMNISEELLRTLKIRAAEQDNTIRELVTEAIEETLKKGGKRKAD